MSKPIQRSRAGGSQRLIKRAEGQDNFWLPISATFPHQSGDGYNVILQAPRKTGA
jgi:hypothetical protein